MREVWYFQTVRPGVVVFMARRIPCPFCGNEFDIPRTMPAEQAIEFLISTHLPIHVAEMESDGKALCSRCQRYEVGGLPVGNVLHRACWSAACDCSCSATPSKTPEFSDGQESE